MQSKLDHYAVLQVDPRAEVEVIHAAAKALAVKHNGENAVLNAINSAKVVLEDTHDRAKYDLERNKKAGKVIGDYRITEKIAEGGFGTTYKAEHLKLKMPVCIKHALNISPTDTELLLEEARAMWDLRHWGIPAIRDMLAMPDTSLALVMSYVPGPTLAEVKQKYPDGIDAEHVAWIAERMLNVLRYLHLHGVVHGDVKPQNVIVQPKSHTIVLVDYGLASLRPSRNTTTKGYTPFFAAPEQIEGKPPLPESDLYSLGMTLVYALGGDVEHVRVPDSTPDSLCKFIKSLIRLNPLSRPSWEKEDLCEAIVKIRKNDFGRSASGMKPLKV